MALTQQGQPVRTSGIRRRRGRTGGLLFALDLAVLFMRVGVIVTAWLALFLAAFFGYLTVPFVVLLIFIAGYAVLDRVRVGRRREVERRRRILEEAVPDPVYGSDERS